MSKQTDDEPDKILYDYGIWLSRPVGDDPGLSFSDAKQAIHRYSQKMVVAELKELEAKLPRKYTPAQVFNSAEFYGYNKALGTSRAILTNHINAIEKEMEK